MTDQELEGEFKPLEEAARADLNAEGFANDAIALERLLDLRYLGQSYEMTVPYGSEYRAEFDRMHQSAYGYRHERRTVEIVNVRLRATAVTDKPALPGQLALSTAGLPSEHKVLQAIFDGVPQRTPVFRSELLKPGMAGAGPAIIAGAQSTAVVPPGWRFLLDSVRTLVLTFPRAFEEAETT